MSEVQKIEKAVEDLSEPQLAEFRRWFIEFDGDTWDKQIETDIAAGKLNVLAEEALSEYRSGKSREL
ncbi:MAG: hypothetical protein ACRER1_03820 [Gammaproteobacteria bacterium]